MVTCCRWKLAAGKGDMFSLHLGLLPHLPSILLTVISDPCVEHREREEITLVSFSFSGATVSSVLPSLCLGSVES